MHNTIKREVIRQMYEDLAAFAIDCPLKFALSQEAQEPEVVQYLKELKEKKEDAIESVMKGIPQDVTRAEFIKHIVRMFAS